MITDNNAYSTNNITSSNATVVGPNLVFEVIETLLLYCSPLLPQNMRNSIEIVIGEGISCMAKGILCPQSYDRKNKRSMCEALRRQPDLQLMILKLAGTEILTSGM